MADLSPSAVAAVAALILVHPHGAWGDPADALLQALELGTRGDFGLGGDPFPSPVAGEAGWWADGRIDSADWIRFKLHTDVPVTRRLSTGRGRLERVVGDVMAGRVWSESGRTADLRFTFRRIYTDSRWDNHPSHADLDETGSAGLAEIRLGNALPGLDVKVAVPLARSDEVVDGSPLRGGAHYRCGDRLAVEGWLSRRTCWPRVTVALDGGFVDSPLNLDLAEREIGARVRILGRLAAESRIRETRVGADRALTDSLRYEFLPDGLGTFRQHGLDWGNEDGFRLCARYTELEAGGGGNGIWGGQRYARLSHGHRDLHSWIVAGQAFAGRRVRFLVDQEWGRFEGFGRAEIESWHFASWQTAWLNGTRVFQGDLRGRWSRSHVAYDVRGGHASFRGAFTLYEIRPDLRLESWTKVLLGRRDEDVVEPASDRYTLGAVSQSVRVAFAGWLVSAEVHQFVFADDHRRVEGTPGEPGAGTTGGWYGGTFAEVACEFVF